MHEIGHAIGLLHSTSNASVMYPFNGNIQVLAADDVNGARAFYGWDAQEPIPGVGTDRGPSLCACGAFLALAWKGIAEDDRIYYAFSSDGLTWSPQQALDGAGSDDSPSLAWDGTQLWMSWRGVPGDTSLYYSTTTNLTAWPAGAVRSIPGVGSSNGPCIAMTPGPTLVWKGAGDDSSVYVSTFNGANNPPWQAQQGIGGIGTSDRPALGMDATGQPLLVWKGVGDDSSLYVSTKTGIFWQPQQRLAWIVPGNGGAGTSDVEYPGTSYGPAITTDGTRVFLLWHGASNDQGIWFTQRAQDVLSGIPVIEWSSQGAIPDVGSSHRPAAAFFKGRFHVAWKGADDDHTIYMSQL
jgi:hypothetical protein